MQNFGFNDQEIQLLEQYMGDMTPLLNSKFNQDAFKLTENSSMGDFITKKIAFNIPPHYSKITNKAKLEDALKKWVKFVKRYEQTSDNTLVDTTPLLLLSISIARAVSDDYESKKIWNKQEQSRLQDKLYKTEQEYLYLHEENAQFIQKVNQLCQRNFSKLEDIFEYLQEVPDWLQTLNEVKLAQNRSKNNPFLINGY